MFLPVCVGHVFFVSYELYREHQRERNLTKHHRNTIAPSSCYTPFNKIIATVTKQLASQIIEPIFLIYVDLRWLRDLHFRYRGLLLVSLGALGLTFGTTQGHQKDHLGPPWRTSETRHGKNVEFLELWGSLLMSSGTLGVTFWTTQGHQKGHLGPPWRTFETRHRKHPKKSLFGDLFWDPNWMIFLVFFCPCFYMRYERRKWGQNVTKYAEKGCRNYTF